MSLSLSIFIFKSITKCCNLQLMDSLSLLLYEPVCPPLTHSVRQSPRGVTVFLHIIVERLYHIKTFRNFHLLKDFTSEFSLSFSPYHLSFFLLSFYLFLFRFFLSFASFIFLLVCISLTLSQRYSS